MSIVHILWEQHTNQKLELTVFPPLLKACFEQVDKMISGLYDEVERYKPRDIYLEWEHPKGLRVAKTAEDFLGMLEN